MDYFIQLIVNGLLVGGIYGVVAVGFSLAWGVLGIINVAHGSMVILGAYFTYVLSKTGVNPLLLLPVVMLLMYGVGYAMQSVIINRVMGRSLLLTLIITFGLELILINVMVLIWTADFKSVGQLPPGHLTLGNVLIPYGRLLIFVVACSIIILTHFLLLRTRFGRAVRAVALNRQAAQLYGVNLAQVYNHTLGISAALAGAAGVLVAMAFTFNGDSGTPYIVRAFVLTVMGGLGSIFGVLLAGLFLGVVETLGGAMLGTGFQEVIGLLLFLVIMVTRPQGLVGLRFYGEDNR